MWQPPWGGHSFLGAQQTRLQCGGCTVTLRCILENLTSPTGQWIPPGPAVWQSPSVTAPPGMSSGCHHHMAPVPATPHGSPYCYSICSTSVISTSRWSSVYWNFFSSRPRTNKLWLNLHQRLCRLLKWISTSWKKDWWKLWTRNWKVLQKHWKLLCSTTWRILLWLPLWLLPKWRKPVLGYLCPMFKMVFQWLLQYQLPLKFSHLQKFLCYQVKQSRIHVLKRLCLLTQHPNLQGLLPGKGPDLKDLKTGNHLGVPEPIEDLSIAEELVLVDIIEETMHQLAQDLDIKIVHYTEVKLRPHLPKLASHQDVTFPIQLISKVQCYPEETFSSCCRRI